MVSRICGSVVVTGSRRRPVLHLDHTCLLLAGAVDWMVVEFAPLEPERWLSSKCRGCSLVRYYLEAGKGKCRVVTNMHVEFF